MQQTEMANFIQTTINAQNGINQAQQAKQAPQKKGGKLLNAAKEVGITAALGVTGGAAAGAITSLIPIKDTERVSNLLCDTFIRSSMNTMGLSEEKLPDLEFKNAQEQLQKAQEYIKAEQILDNKELAGDVLKNAQQKISDTAWALKESAIEYINKAAKGDNLLNFAKKEAKKARTAEVMKNSVSIGLSAASILLLFNIIEGAFGKKGKNTENTQK